MRDATCRFRWILIGVRNDISHPNVDLRHYLADHPSPMRPLLDPAHLIPDHLWLDYSAVIPKTTGDAGEKPGIDDIVDRSTWGASTFAHLIGWHTQFGKGYRIYDIDYPSPTITSFGNILIYDDRFDPYGVRQCTVGELARFSSFDNETISFLQSLPEHDALQCIANAVPMGMSSTVYGAIIDHANACHRAEQAFVTLRSGFNTSSATSPSDSVDSTTRSGKTYNHPMPPPTPSVVTNLTPTPAPTPTIANAIPSSTATPAKFRLPIPSPRPPARPIPPSSMPIPPGTQPSKWITPHNADGSIRASPTTPATNANSPWRPSRPLSDTLPTPTPSYRPDSNADTHRPTDASRMTSRTDFSTMPTRNDFSNAQPPSMPTGCPEYNNDSNNTNAEVTKSPTSLPNVDPTTDGQDVPTEKRHQTTDLGFDHHDGVTFDDEGNKINPHLTRDGNSRQSKHVMDINPH